MKLLAMTPALQLPDPHITSQSYMSDGVWMSWSLGVVRSWSLGVWVSWSLGVVDFATCRRNVGFWCEMGVKMDVPTFESAVKKILRALLAGKDTLVHCVQGKHRSGAFLCFVLCLIGGESLSDMINWYLEDECLPYPGDRRCLLRVTQGGGIQYVAAMCLTVSRYLDIYASIPWQLLCMGVADSDVGTHR